MIQHQTPYHFLPVFHARVYGSRGCSCAAGARERSGRHRSHPGEAAELLQDVADMVQAEKGRLDIAPGIMPIASAP